MAQVGKAMGHSDLQIQSLHKLIEDKLRKAAEDIAAGVRVVSMLTYADVC